MSWITATILLHAACAALYVLLSTLILLRRPWSATGLMLGGACVVTAAWAGSMTLIGRYPTSILPNVMDLLRATAWCGFVLHLYRRAVLSAAQRSQAFITMALVGALAVGVTVMLTGGGLTMWSTAVVARLGLAVCSVLLIENLYLNTAPEQRWHINLPCIALGALAVYDIVLSADALLFRRLSPALYDGRAIATSLVAPLLAVAAARNRRHWEVDIHVSRPAVFHSATLMISGVFLLGVVAAGEALRYIGADWGGVAEVSVIFAGLVTIAVLLTSSSTRTRLRFLLVDHFFSSRYDYHQEWMRCITILSAPDAYVALHTRAIRAVAEVLDSPGGVLFLREPGIAAFQWAGSWNMPAATAPVMADDPLVPAFRDGSWVVELDDLADAGTAYRQAGFWIAVPLNHGGRLIGFVLAAPARVPFRLEREAYDLLRIVGRQVATHVAEQRATEVLMQTRQLHEYGKRFAFVAHDIKNVSSQLSLLLSNAEVHLENPEFQRDMLATIRASVAKIGALIKRLATPTGDMTEAVIMPAERLEPLVANARRLRRASVELVDDGRSVGVAMGAAAFDAVVTHLLDNAVEAGREGGDDTVRVGLRHEGRHAMIDIVDRGPGMTPEFIRDALFRPFRTSKAEGSGIGAFQARELLREAGGDLLVISRPGAGGETGTTMRLLLPLVEATEHERVGMSG